MEGLEAPEMEPLGPKSADRIIRFNALSISDKDWWKNSNHRSRRQWSFLLEIHDK